MPNSPDPEIDLPDRVFAFVCCVVRLCQYMESNGNVSRTLANQLLRSATSGGANPDEAQAGQLVAIFTTITKNTRNKT